MFVECDVKVYSHTFCLNCSFIAVNFARQVPHGLLLFFPSYPVMEKCVEQWQVCASFILNTILSTRQQSECR